MDFSDTVPLERWRVQRDAQAFAEIVARYRTPRRPRLLAGRMGRRHGSPAEIRTVHVNPAIGVGALFETQRSLNALEMAEVSS